MGVPYFEEIRYYKEQSDGSKSYCVSAQLKYIYVQIINSIIHGNNYKSNSGEEAKNIRAVAGAS